MSEHDHGASNAEPFWYAIVVIPLVLILFPLAMLKGLIAGIADRLENWSKKNR